MVKLDVPGVPIRLFVLFIALAGLSRPQVAPADGPEFESSGVEMLGWVDLNGFPQVQTRGADIWGYTSPSGREYAIFGGFQGTGFVDITDPTQPNVVGYVDGPDSTWRDMKTHDHYAYIVSQEGDGIQIADLSDIDNGVVTHVTTSNVGGLFGSHNIAYDPDSGYLYPVLSDITGGLAALDTTDPLNLTLAGTWTEVGIHDVQVVTYDEGPNAGREIAFAACQGDGIYIIDVTQKDNMFTVASLTYPLLFYSHQCWASEDNRYLFCGDELDELFNPGHPTTTIVVDIQNLNEPFLLPSFTNGLFASDHNLIVRGEFVFEANYASGLRIYDASDINDVFETGFFDTLPEHNDTGFDGAWGVYTQLPSRNVIVSDRERGLFIFDTSEIDGPPVQGDFDGDGDVDVIDFINLLGCSVNGPGGGVTPGCEVFDFDMDDDVDWSDQRMFQIFFTGS